MGLFPEESLSDVGAVGTCRQEQTNGRSLIKCEPL